MKIIFLIWSLVVAGRLFYLQVISHDKYTAAAEKQRLERREIYGERGKIWFKDIKVKGKFYPLAANMDFYTVAVSPKRVNDELAVINGLSGALNVSTTTLGEKLSNKEDVYKVVKRNIESSLADGIRNLKLDGIILEKESGRFYPEKETGAHISGFVGFKGGEKTGQYGLEGYYEDELRGKRGAIEAEFDSKGHIITSAVRYIEEPKEGAQIYLTIDRTIQFFACEKLKEAVSRFGAEDGTVVIMDPFSGAILAMCGYPSYDPNEYSKVKNISLYINPAISYTYEPGSIFKPITMAAAINENKVTPSTTYEDKGSVKIGSYTIQNSDFKAHGVRTMTQVLEDSLNTGAIFAVRLAGAGVFKKYVHDFGFGETTGIDLSGETRGNISTLDQPSEIYPATASFGQGITVTPIQMLRAYAAIANGGYLVKPFLVESIKNEENTLETSPKILRRIISGTTSNLLSAMLVSVVEKGHGKRASVKGYFVAGKTGTAQVSLPKGGYDPYRSIGSFVGFAPLKDPKFVILVKIDNPHGVQFAESTAAPVFGEIARFLLDYLEVPPERKL